MNNWQQRAEREDPYPDVPFDTGRRWSTDSIVGLVCILAAIVGCVV